MRCEEAMAVLRWAAGEPGAVTPRESQWPSTDWGQPDATAPAEGLLHEAEAAGFLAPVDPLGPVDARLRHLKAELARVGASRAAARARLGGPEDLSARQELATLLTEERGLRTQVLDDSERANRARATAPGARWRLT